MADIQPSKALQFPAWTNDNHCLARRVLNCDLWEQLKDYKTSLTSFTINDVVRSGVAVPTSSNGVYAGDEECYRLEYHGMDKIPAHVSNLDSRCLTSVIHNEASILSTRCRVVRNLYGYGFPPGMSREKRLEVERILVTALESLGGDLSGTYYPYDTMTSSEKQSLIKDGYLFQESDKYQAAAGICRDWPEGRGIFYNNAKTFLVWTAFAFDKQYGYLSSCPTNLGTGMRTSVHMRVPNAFNTAAEFKSTCRQLGLDVRGRHGETSEASEKAVCDVSNRQRMGRTEVELLKILIDGINSLNQYAISG
ncbi:hypothetical protein Bbelb_331230 [Branchiostoma belcheri]|nr:hypothetical protein Bbelb_331230 [Branchiostoma belcheri]